MGNYYIKEIDGSPYIQLTKLAKKHGGPKQLLNETFSKGVMAGVVLSAITSLGIYYVIEKKRKMNKENGDILLEDNLIS